MSLLKEFQSALTGNFKADLKKSDSTDAGASDVAGKMRPNDVTFSSMRNTINSDGEVTGSDVADYLERAGELNDEVDTVPFGLETDDGDVVKVYVNAEQADAFEEEMKKMLGIEDDIEEAINKLAQDFDIVDVVWPKSENNDSSEVLDLDSEAEFDALDDGDEMDVVAEYDPLDDKKVNEEELGEVEDPKEPTSEEAAAFRKLNEVVMHLAAQGSSGVAAATGYDRESFTKLEMIARYVKDKYKHEAEVARGWLERAKDEDDVLPYWLKESLQTQDTDEQLGEEDMSLGSQFLKRLTEATKPAGFDAGTEAAKRQLRTIGGNEKNYGDKIAEVLNMCGVAGMYLKKKDVIDSIAGAAEKLRSNSRQASALLTLHGALKSATGMVMEKNVELTGGAFMQLMEEVMVSLGAPVDLVGADAKAAVKTRLRQLATDFSQDPAVSKAFKAYARAAGIKVSDDITGAKPKAGTKIGEAEAPAVSMSDTLAAKKIFDKIKGTPNMSKAIVKMQVKKYLPMVGKSDSDLTYLFAQVWSKLEDMQPMKEAVGAGTEPTRGNAAPAAGQEDDDGADGARITDVVAAAKSIFKTLGVDLDDTTQVRMVNSSAVNRAILAAGRNATVKAAMGTFLKKTGAK